MNVGFHPQNLYMLYSSIVNEYCEGKMKYNLYRSEKDVEIDKETNT